MLWLFPLAVFAHNGQVALAVPVQGIAADGDLGDWPAGMRTYPLNIVVAGTPPQSKADFTGTFRVGYEAAKNALYVAVEVQDESSVTKPDEWRIWNSEDGCQVSIDWAHGEQARLVQYTVYGDQGQAYVGSGVVELADREEVRLGMRRRQGVHQYEWRVDLGRLSAGQVQLRPGMVLGLGVAASDVDADGSVSWLGWGSVVVNPFAPLDDLGDVLLVESEAAVGRVEGKVIWEGTGEAVRYGDVRLEQPGMQVVARTDRAGWYGVEVPAGRYRLAPWIGGDPQEVEVKPASVAEVSARVRSPEGKVTRAGEGRRKKMGSGVHQGLWTTWEEQDGLSAHVRARAVGGSSGPGMDWRGKRLEPVGWDPLWPPFYR